MTDTHCHLYLDQFSDDIMQVIDHAVSEGIHQFYLPCIDSSVIDKMLELESRFPAVCYAMMGLHPCSVKENYLEELEVVEGWLKKRKFVAVGEIGLDFYWDRNFEKQQYESFHRQADLAVQFGLPVVIHSRNATDECINLLKGYQSRALKGVFHCFGGSYAQALEIIACGFYLGVGGVITYKNAGLAEVLAEIPLEHMVLETDAPYLSPVPFRGKRNESSYLRFVAAKLAEVKGVSKEYVATITTVNAEKLFVG